jgi:site-specific DNA recombinase
MSLPFGDGDDKPKRVYLYARVSTEDQVDRGTIGAQVDFLQNFCKLYGLTPAGIYMDDGISGTIPLGERPEGRRLLDEARDGEVITYRLDRLGRKLAVLLEAHALLEQAGLTIRSATEPFDTATPIGKFLFQLLGSLAELEKSTISERMTMGRDRVARNGKWAGGPVPYGYDLDAERHLIPSARIAPGAGVTEAEVMQEVFANLEAGSTLGAEIARLNGLGVPCTSRWASGTERSRSAVWYLARLRFMVHNPVYKGENVLDSRHGQIVTQVPALVSAATWDAVHAQLLRNRRLSDKNAVNRYLLRGLITCANCGASYTGITPTKRGARAYAYYWCNAIKSTGYRPDRPRCPGKVLRADWLEAEVWRGCREYIDHPGDMLADAQAELRRRLADSAGHEERRRDLLRQIAEKDQERERVMTLYRRNRATLEETERQLDAIGTETAALRQMLEALKAQDELGRAFEAQIVATTAMLSDLRARADEAERTGDWDTKRGLIERLVTRITVTTTGEEKRGEPPAVDIYFAFGRRHAPESAPDVPPSGGGSGPGTLLVDSKTGRGS